VGSLANEEGDQARSRRGLACKKRLKNGKRGVPTGQSNHRWKRGERLTGGLKENVYIRNRRKEKETNLLILED